MRSGRDEGVPFSLSRWTDVPAAKWDWMEEAIRQQQMIAFDQRTGVPSYWSLKPEDTLGLLFWTKDPTRLFTAPWIWQYNFQVHVTVTGWREVEKGAPSLIHGAELLKQAARVFDPKRVFWRFSPVPIVSDVVQRFEAIAYIASEGGIRDVYVSFLQPNDRIPETRSPEERLDLIFKLADMAAQYDMTVKLCNEQRLLFGEHTLPSNLSVGVCAQPEAFAQPGLPKPGSEECGCALMADPFTITEACSMGCLYCYAQDQTLAAKPRNTTRRLPVVR